MNNWFKRNSVHFIIIGIFIAISFAYFFTPLTKGKALSQYDVVQARAMQKEIMDVREKTGKAPLWTDAMFGGMPSYQIWTPYPANITSYLNLSGIFPKPVDTVLLYLLGAYLLFCVLRVNPWIAAAGAIAFAFSSYNFILISAGHANQAYAITYFAPVLAGIILSFRGRYLLGSALTALFISLEIRTNHIQMTYYLLLSIAILVIIELYHAIKKKELAAYFKTIAYLAVATILAIAVNAAMLWTTFEYGKESNRGQSNLTQHTKQPSNGLDKDYAYGWSQGVGECFTFLIPNAYGGASGPSTIDPSTSKMTDAFVAKGVPQDQAVGIVQQLSGMGISTYWGNKPSTSGPFYFGAVVCFLFVFGLLAVRSRLKWWILATVILTMLLSFGKNFPYVSDIFFHYFPLYNKFRTVESILAVACLCFPLLAFLGVQEIITTTDKPALLKKLMLAFYITGGITLLMLVLPELLLSYRGDEYQNLITGLTQAFKGDSAMANAVGNGLVQDRISLERADALRTLIFIVLAFGVLWALLKQKISLTLASGAIILLTLVDMWGVDRRYLKDDNFVDKETLDKPFPMREVDQFILRDTDPDFRVFDMTLPSGPFSDAQASYYHKTVGGYHAAKLKRFDELIGAQFSNSVNQDVLDMLNTKYIITADPKTQAVGMHKNETACGNAWFVKKVNYAENADQEMQAISSFAPKDEAIVDKRYRSLVDEKNSSFDPAGTITLTSYSPDHLVYQSGATTSQVAVFSEIYYDKGWTMLIDGVEKPYFRADYVLRAAQIPVGNHKIEFIFHPASYYTGETISLIGSILLVLALAGAVYVENKNKPVAPQPAGKKAA